VLRAFDTALVALHDSRDTLRANLIVRSRLADIRLAAAVGESELAALDGGFITDDYRGRIRIETERDDSGGKRDPGLLYRVTVTVWHEATAFRHTIVTFVRTPPKPAEEEATAP